MDGVFGSAKSDAFCIDNLVYLRNCNEKKFDVVIADPEYRDVNQPDIANRAKGGFKDWKGAPKEEFFYHIQRVSREQIVFGGNYFTSLINPLTGLPFLEANNNWYVWDKKMARGLHYSMAEFAWVSFRKNIQIFRHRSMAESWHETGKPRELYLDVFKTYLYTYEKELGYKPSILDPNLGSGSSRMVAFALGFPFTGLEIREECFKKSEIDFERYKSENGFFVPKKEDSIFRLDEL